jgi:hypothetical protein
LIPLCGSEPSYKNEIFYHKPSSSLLISYVAMSHLWGQYTRDDKERNYAHERKCKEQQEGLDAGPAQTLPRHNESILIEYWVIAHAHQSDLITISLLVFYA